ncbi:MAG: small multi-drug export protein [Candidatus Woesearchaeota archaeon]|nr:small multi-drug export protein [Candidatus Woesearchaeota archaeon]
MNILLWAALLSLTPVGELRAGIPVALAGGANPWLAFVVCVIANILVVPIVFFFLEFVHVRLLHVKSYQSAFDRFMERTRVKVKPYLNKYGMLGLAVFVAIPIPGTGAWTASLAAWFLGMNLKKSFLAILLGVAVAGAIVLGALLGGIKLVGWAVA